MTITPYDYDVVADNNNAAPPDGFPESMQFSEVNDAMREHMARKARFIIDAGGGGPKTTQSQPHTSGAVDRVVKNEQLVLTPPAGFICVFRMEAAEPDNENPVWLGPTSDGPFHPLQYPGGGAVLPGSLKRSSIYRAVFTGSAWQLLCNLKGTFVDTFGREVSPADGALELLPSDIGGLVASTLNVANTGNTLRVSVSAGTLDRWPVGGLVELISVDHLFVSFQITGASSVSLVNGGSRGLATNSVMYLRVMKVDALTLQVFDLPRAVL